MSVITEPQVHLWTRYEYNQMAQLGLFTGKRVELIEGQVIEMSPMGSLHATAIALAARTVEPAFGDRYFSRWQMPFAISDISEPEPDVAIVLGAIRDYVDAHPTTAALIIEVADTSLTYDRETKGSLYAKAGIEDYWIVNLVARQVEVYRQPIVDEEALYGYRYADKVIYGERDTITPLAQPGATIAVSDILP
jgi:Uma2 family endonuclease